MSKFPLFLLFILVAGLTGGAVFLAAWEIPAPTAEVVKVIPNERFAK